jgi:uncharacterized repeat protein (TIGR03806 family)
VLAFPKLTFDRPVVLAAMPGSNRLFVGEVGGKVYSFPNDPECPRADLAVDLAATRQKASALYGIAFHPRFEANRYVYLCYTIGYDKADGTHVSRFKVSRDNPPRIDPESETLLITWYAGGHNAGCLQFGPDGDLYIAAGDGADPTPPDPFKAGQDLGALLSKIMRIDVDHQDPGKHYKVPPDNPFVGFPGARPEVWAYGFRNPWRFSFDRRTGDLWAGDVGWELWELVYKVDKGGNYGWSIMEGRQPVRTEGQRGPTPIIPPVVDHPHSEAASITGGYVYRGSKFPDLVGAYVYGDFQTGKVWGLRHDGKAVTWHRELAETPVQLVSFAEDLAGELYLIDYERTKQIYSLAPNKAVSHAEDFPRKLSRTGLFASVKDQKPAPGVIPYAIVAELWSDGATAERLLALPGRSQIAVDDDGKWKFPDGSVLARTVSIEREVGQPSSRRRLETQVLHLEDESWRPYTYIWDDDQADASLADAKGASTPLTIIDPRAPGGRRELTYRFSARSECLQCHNPWVEKQTTMFGRQSASPLAANALQLDRDHQLRTFARLGLFSRPLPARPEDAPKLANPYDESDDLGRRARSYLHVNCSHCHQFGAGGSTNMQLTFSLPLDQTKTVGARPLQGTFNIAGARIIAPGDPGGSVLYYRTAKLGSGRMPRVGSNVVDERAVALIHDWIEGLPAPESGHQLSAADRAAIRALEAGSRSSAQSKAEAIGVLTGSTRGALALMRLVDRGRLEEPVRREVLAATKDHPQAEDRDLFERFLPDSERVKRLGDAIDFEKLLALPGDPGSGKQVFFAGSSAQCKNCHRIGGEGRALGPDLDEIGSKYEKPALLHHILDPSRAIDPQYLAYLLETRDGQVHSGLLVEKTETEVVLRDAQGELIRVPARDVEQLAPQQKSLMPDLLLRDMTAQQVADLLDYLATLKAKR